jgi:hypothetical protein
MEPGRERAQNQSHDQERTDDAREETHHIPTYEYYPRYFFARHAACIVQRSMRGM